MIKEPLNSTIFYVYAYLRKKDLTPYYIGKGCKDRAYNNKAHRISVPKDKSKIVFLETNLTELGAFALERRYIRWYGRKDKGTGLLLNLTDGGEGTSGRIFSQETRKKISIKTAIRMFGNIPTKETRKKISKAHMGNQYSLGKIPWNKGKKLPEELKTNMRNPKTEEHKKKLSIARKGKIPWNKGKIFKKVMSE